VAYRRLTMTIGELMATLRTMDPDRDVFVAVFAPDGTGEAFAIEAVQAHDGDAQLDIYTEDEGFDADEGNGAVRPGETRYTDDPADTAAEAFRDFCERRGITEAEKDLIWNAMAFLCYEQVQSRHGPFYEAIKPFLAEDET
jgi:hypothetical protein